MILQLPLTAVLLVAAGVTASTDADVTYRDADGDLVTISLDGPGRLDVRLDGDVATNADATRVAVAGANGDTTLRVSIERGATRIGVVETNDAIGRIVFAGAVHGPMRVRACRVGELRFENGVSGVTVSVLESIDRVVIAGTLDASSIAAATLTHLAVAGDVRDSHVLAGARLDGSGDLTRGQYHAATIVSVRVGGDVVDSIIAAGGDPGVDGRFEDGDILSGGLIESLEVGGVIAGRQSPHVNPGIYAARIGWLHVNGIAGAGKGPTPGMTTGSAVIDPQPSAEAALKKSRVKRILERASKRAVQLGVNATIAITDREGNLLGVVRMDEPPLAAAKTTVKIRAGGKNGLEAVDNFIPTSIIAATKAGTAAFLSTSKGNAFTTRTAGYIIQEHFPPGILFQDGGPLFGVQLSSLPTSDVNRLPLGLSADPGGLPLYRMGELVGGIGVEADGVYTVDPTLVGGASTVEEEIALAGQIGLEPPAEIRADTIFVDGIRLDYANARPPKLSSLNSLRPYANLVASGRLVELLPPRTSPTGVSGRTTMFAKVKLGTLKLETPDASRAPAPSMSPDDPGAPGALGLDFWDEATKTFDFVRGDANGSKRLSPNDVRKILQHAHEANERLRAAIRRDHPKRSQVTVAVVDLNGNILGVLRSRDAPVFGYDVAVQKARTAAFFSRTDAGDEIKRLDHEVDVAAIQAIDLGSHRLIDPSLTRPYARHVNKARTLGVELDGSVAVADRTGGFLSRPRLPDGLEGAPRGPFTALPPDRFSPFNTGLQTVLILPELVEFLMEFTALDESIALARFTNGVVGDGGGVVPLDDNAGDAGPDDLNPGGGLPGRSLANGMQIFAGSVPLYEGGRLVGGVGVSGDGIEQDDYVAIEGAHGYQQFGSSVTRADEVHIAGGIRLPYVKFPRARFEGQ